MTRLGLSNSMRSNASMQGTKAVKEAETLPMSYRQCSAKMSETHSKQEAKPKFTLFVLSNPSQIVVGSILAVILLFSVAEVFSSSLQSWSSSATHVGEQLERLGKSVSLLSSDTVRLKTTADRFLKICQESHLAASTRKKMLQSSAMQTFHEQVKTQIKEHMQVTREILQYYTEQKLRIQETRDRLLMMNISLPVETAVRLIHMDWQEKQKIILDGDEVLEKDDTRAHRLSDAMKELVLFAEKTQLQHTVDPASLHVESISIHRNGTLESNNRQTDVAQSTLRGTSIFYVVVVCASAVYLYHASLCTKMKELLETKRSWPSVSKAVRRLKRSLESFVIIEDLRPPTNKDVSSNLLEPSNIDQAVAF